ncbi:MAG TPA: ATP-dependent helicase HrpB [Methylovirgula sp.]|nr:ATP-dependent helicase HrpB [Methylovirgula sp.]
MQWNSLQLPIEAVLPRLGAALGKSSSVTIVAPPGAGKTTIVPLALKDADWAAGRKLVLLEPRRLAARAAAERMAALLGEPVGETVGLRMRLLSRVSARTRILVVTEGVFTRMILEDPGLEEIAGILFDEFHERSLDADFGLALALDVQAHLRPDLRLIVMSATLDGARVARLLGEDVPLIEAEGRAFPVETLYLGRGDKIETDLMRAVLRALAEQRGSVLVFLPGQGEILRLAAALNEKIKDPAVDIAPLYGALDRAAQDRAIAPSPEGRRKIVLATSIAETSLTIEGVRVVIDSGLARLPRYEPDRGLTRLETQRVSRASADQRRGRAGRTEPGVCYRLWEEAANGALEAFAPAEILSTDLSSLLLDCSAWGARDPARDLRFLDPPPAPALAEARALLTKLGAIDAEGALTDLGRAMRRIALPPRLARMIVAANENGEARLAAEVAVVMVERGLGGEERDLVTRIERFRRERSPRAEDARRLVASLTKQAGASAAEEPGDPARCGRHLAAAFSDRIAKARGKPGEFLMANGRAAALDPHDPLARESYLAVGEIAGRAGAARILLAAPSSLAEIEELAGEEIVTREDLNFDRVRGQVQARRQRRLGALVLSEQNLSAAEHPAAAAILAEGIASAGLLPWTKALNQWRDRVTFLRRNEGEAWPDLSDEALRASAGTWLAPFLAGKTRLSEIAPADLESALKALLPYDLQRRLETEAPTHFETPAGSRIALDYAAEGGPLLCARVQELYGLDTHPAVAKGRVPLTLELLSPAQRPIQITRDLPGFWRGSWAAVRSEMKGRYPRHLWPEDPTKAQPTTRAKPRGT